LKRKFAVRGRHHCDPKLSKALAQSLLRGKPQPRLILPRSSGELQGKITSRRRPSAGHSACTRSGCSFQFGRESVPTDPAAGAHMRGPNVGIATSSGQRSALSTALWWQFQNDPSSDRTPSWRMLPNVVSHAAAICASKGKRPPLGPPWRRPVVRNHQPRAAR
jgi:hypothetical protein